MATHVEQSTDNTASYDLGVTALANHASLLNMQYCIYRKRPDADTLKSLQQTLINILPDLLKEPSCDGEFSFFNFKTALGEAEVTLLIKEVEAIYPNMCPLDARLIIDAHAAIRQADIGADLPYQELGRFLILLHDHAAPGWSVSMLVDVVSNIIHDIKVASRLNIVEIPTVTEEADVDSDTVPFLVAHRQFLCDIMAFFTSLATQLREQHGGIQKHSSLDDLMTKISNCVDKTALMVLEQQVFAIHAEQAAAGIHRGITFIKTAIDGIDMIFGRA